MYQPAKIYPSFSGSAGAFRRLPALHVFRLRLSLHAVRHSVHRRLVEDVFRPAVRQADLPAFIRHAAHASARRHEAHGLPVIRVCTFYPFSADLQRKLPAFQRQAAALSVRQAVIRPGFPVILYGTVAPRGIAPGIRIPVSARRSHRRHHAACERQRQHLHHKLLPVLHCFSPSFSFYFEAIPIEIRPIQTSFLRNRTPTLFRPLSGGRRPLFYFCMLLCVRKISNISNIYVFITSD